MTKSYTVDIIFRYKYRKSLMCVFRLQMQHDSEFYLRNIWYQNMFSRKKYETPQFGIRLSNDISACLIFSQYAAYVYKIALRKSYANQILYSSKSLCMYNLPWGLVNWCILHIYVYMRNKNHSTSMSNIKWMFRITFENICVRIFKTID